MKEFYISWTEDRSIVVEADNEDEAMRLWKEQNFNDDDITIENLDEPEITEN